MNTSLEILVVILSTALAILLTISIVVAVMAYKLMQTIKRITDKAEHVVESAEHVGEALSNATGSMAVFKIVRNVMTLVSKQRNKKGK